MLSSKTKRELKIDQRQILIDSIEIGIPSPQQILSWGERLLPNGKKVGLIKNSKTVNYKRFTPFRDGLFCERIFGPVTSFVCACGKKQPHSKVTFCEKCEVEYIDQRSRRYRLGYISLFSPVTHIWYLKGRPSYLSLFLGKRKKTVVALAYCNAYLIEHGIYKKHDNDNVKNNGIWPYKKSIKLKEQKLPLQEKLDFLNRKLEKTESYKTKFFMPFCETKHLSIFLSFVKKKNLGLSFKVTPLDSYFSSTCLQSSTLFARKRKQSFVNTKFVRELLCKKTLPKCKIEQNLCLSYQASAYGSYFYTRQHTLPFLPSLICHFYLRDTLLNFIYSLPSYDDFPLMEYCHIKRWEPLRDVHKFMAHKTVDTLKNNYSSNLINSIKSFSRQIHNFEELRGYKIDLKPIKSNFITEQIMKAQKNRRFSFTKQFQKKSFLRLSKAELYTSFSRPLQDQTFLLKNKYVWQGSRKVFSFANFNRRKQGFENKPTFATRNLLASTNQRFVRSFVLFRKQGLANKFIFATTNLFARNLGGVLGLPTEPLPFAYKYKSEICKKLCQQNPNFLPSANLVTNCRFVFARRFLVAKANTTVKRNFFRQSRQRKFVTNLAFVRKQGPKEQVLQIRDLYAPPNFRYYKSSLSALPKKAPYKSLICSCTSQKVRNLEGLPRKKTDSFFKSSFFLEKKASSFSYIKKGCTIRKANFFMAFARFCKTKVKASTSFNVKVKTHFPAKLYMKFIRKKLVSSFIQKWGVFPNKKQKTSTSAKFFTNPRLVLARKFVKLEENNSSLLSGLEVTAIREILSYTGGGALHQLLESFDGHNLCKFLFAESQILRVLYETLISTGLHLPEKSVSSENLFCTPFLQAQNFASTRFSDSSLEGKNSLKKKPSFYCKKVCATNLFLMSSKKEEQDFFSKKKENTDTTLFCNKFISSKTKPLPEGAGVTSTNRRFVRRFVRATKDSFFNVDSAKTEKLLTCKLKTMSSKKGLYDDFQNKIPDLQKKQILRISRRIYKVARRLKITQLLTRNHRKPEWMILSHLPVLPPDLRPILQMSEKVIVASDLNIMYQRVIYRNNRHLRVRFIDFHLVTAIQRLVQDAVDRLIENGKGGSKPYYTQGGRPLKSLSDILKGKKGRFRLNLLGKRVDFSGRSVIVVSPLCQIHECGLPKDIALELYHYFLLRQLIVKKHCASIVTAKKMIKSKSSLMWDVLRELMYHHPVLLNRAPTLHRLGIQAFQPKLVLGNAILLHPLVCSGFNADFDGDQMGVHLPLSFAARAESWDLLWSRNNLLSPATGQPMLVPSQDMVLGFYYITAQALQTENSKRFLSDKFKICPANLSSLRKNKENDLALQKKAFTVSSTLTKPNLFVSTKANRFLNLNDIITGLQTGKINLHQPVWLNWSGKIENEELFQKPLELRIYGFGKQQSIYENYISSNFFTKIRVRVEADLQKYKQAMPFLPLVSSSFYISNFPFFSYIESTKIKQPTQNMSTFSKKKEALFSEFAELCMIEDEAQEHKHLENEQKTRFYKFTRTSINDNSFLISNQSKAYYIRTTAGRVLMNNLIKN